MKWLAEELDFQTGTTVEVRQENDDQLQIHVFAIIVVEIVTK